MNTKTSKDVVTKPKTQLKVEAKLKKKQEEQKIKRFDMAKIILAIILVVAGIWLFYVYDMKLSIYIRYIFPVIGTILAIVIVFFWCSSGRALVNYVRDATAEAKKVVWPERNETLRMTLFVLIFVGILALFIWGVDSFISWVFFDILLKRG